jgi:hypothetical protein
MNVSIIDFGRHTWGLKSVDWTITNPLKKNINVHCNITTLVAPGLKQIFKIQILYAFIVIGLQWHSKIKEIW